MAISEALPAHTTNKREKDKCLAFVFFARYKKEGDMNAPSYFSSIIYVVVRIF